MIKPVDLLKILVIDDTALYRKIITEVLNDIPGVEVVDTATNGLDAMEKIHFYKPDLLTLDLEMPDMNGLEVLTQLQTKAPDMGAVVISTHSEEGGEMTIKALNRGAFDFILKPEDLSFNDNKKTIKEQLEIILEGYRFCRKRDKANVVECREVYRGAVSDQRKNQGSSLTHQKFIPDIIALGVSTGGPRALAEILVKFPADFPIPIVIAQHMPSGFTSQLATSLNRKCALEVREAEHMELLSPGRVFIAPGGKQMKIEKGPVGIKHICISDDEPGQKHKPSIDFLFRSVAELFGPHATGVIMTGMGRDGLQGSKEMKKKGATIIVQNEESCVVYGMPAAVFNAGVADQVVPLSDLADSIKKTLG